MKLSFHLLFIYTRGIRPLNFETIKIEILPGSIGYRWEKRDLRDSDDTVREQTRRRRRRERCFRTCVRREEGDLHLFRGSPCRKYHSTTASYCAIKPGFASILHFREALHRAWNVRGETRLVSGKIVDKLGVNGSRVSVRESRENWRVLARFIKMDFDTGERASFSFFTFSSYHFIPRRVISTTSWKLAKRNWSFFLLRTFFFK